VWQAQNANLDEDGGDFLAVGINEGYPVLRYELGGGPANITIEELVNDGNDHELEVKRQGKIATFVLDGKTTVTGESEGLLNTLDVKLNLFVGGGPDLDGMTGGRFLDGFSGCLHSLELGNKVVNFKTDSVRAVNVVPCDQNELNEYTDEDYKDFYSSLLDEDIGSFDEDEYLERLNRLG